MTKQELINEFVQNHLETIHYIDLLNDFEFNFKKEEKWSAGQQLQHISLTIAPFPKVLGSKEYLLEKFGKIDRPVWNYNTVLENYSKSSLKSPEQFLPQNDVTFNNKTELISEMKINLEGIQALFNNYSEDELDSLTLPHPLLGKLTIREMFYLMSYHPIHHKKQIENALNSQQ